MSLYVLIALVVLVLHLHGGGDGDGVVGFQIMLYIERKVGGGRYLLCLLDISTNYYDSPIGIGRCGARYIYLYE